MIFILFLLLHPKGMEVSETTKNMNNKFVVIPILFLFLIVGVLRINYGLVLVDGTSMEPTLKDNSVLLFYHYNNKVVLRRQQFVVYWSEDNDKAVKRVIGLPNETISIVNNEVIIDDVPINESYLMPSSLTYPYRMGNISMKIPSDSVFVMGDSRTNSVDSRFYGPIKISSIIFYK